MPVLQLENLADITTDTLRDLGRKRIVDLTTSLRRFVALPALMQKNRITFGSGYGTRWQIMFASSVDHARFVPLFSRDQVGAGDVMKYATMNFRHMEWSWGFDEHEVDANMGENQIVDLIKSRDFAAEMKGYELVESAIWSCPSASDEISPHGIPYHIVQNDTTGFNGGHASGYSDWAGLSRTTYPLLKNYTFRYDEISKLDLIRKIRDAAYEVDFESPVKNPSMATYEGPPDYGMYTVRAVVRAFEEACEDQNMNLGNDVASKDGMSMILRHTITPVPQLDATTTNQPWYGINWGAFKTAIKTPWWMKTKRVSASGQHNVINVFKDSTFEWEMWNPRTCFVGSTLAA